MTSDSNFDVNRVRSYLEALQTRIADALGAFDGTPLASPSCNSLNPG